MQIMLSRHTGLIRRTDLIRAIAVEVVPEADIIVCNVRLEILICSADFCLGRDAVLRFVCAFFELHLSREIDGRDGQFAFALKPVDGRDGIRRIGARNEMINMLTVMDRFIQSIVKGGKSFFRKSKALPGR